jgi:hypothetical protein
MRSRSDLRRVIFVNYYVIANSFLLGIFSVNLFLGSLLVFVHVDVHIVAMECRCSRQHAQCPGRIRG